MTAEAQSILRPETQRFLLHMADSRVLFAAHGIEVRRVFESQAPLDDHSMRRLRYACNNQAVSIATLQRVCADPALRGVEHGQTYEELLALRDGWSAQHELAAKQLAELEKIGKTTLVGG